MAVYIPKITDSNITPFDFNKVMSSGDASSAQLTIDNIISISPPITLGFITPNSVPNSDLWEDGGTWTLDLAVFTGSNKVDARARCIRINGGTIIGTGPYTPTQDLKNSRAFTLTNPFWNDNNESADNRLAIEIELSTTFHVAQSVTIDVGVSDNTVITTNITENISTQGGLRPEAINLFIDGFRPRQSERLRVGWEIYYDDFTIIDNDDMSWVQAPSSGVCFVLELYDSGERLCWMSKDYYYMDRDFINGAQISGYLEQDASGFAHIRSERIKSGIQVDENVWNEVHVLVFGVDSSGASISGV